MPKTDKVKFNIKNVHIFPMLTDAPTYDDVIDFPGAVSLSLDAQGDINKFYADGIVYYQTSSNNGYSGDLEMAMIPDAIWEKIFNYVKDTDNVFTENANKNVVPFAMSFEEDGDQTGTKFVLYNCTATRPSKSFATKEESIEPTTQTISISAAPLKDGNVLAMSGADTTVAVLNDWHTDVYGYNKTSGV